MAFVLSACVPGLGQIYNAQMTKGFLLFASVAGFLLLSGAIGLVHSFKGVLVHIALLLVGEAFIIGEATLTAIRQVRRNSLSSLTLPSYIAGGLLLSIALLVGAGDVIPDRIPGIHAYTVTADSMAPTLVSDDRFISDTRYFKRQPPQRGDVIAFREPASGVMMVKRVLAVAGDSILLRGRSLEVNGKSVAESYAQYDLEQFQFESGDFGPLTVPSRHAFVLGDNRSHSLDSCHFGPVGVEAIMSKPLFIYWSSERSRIGQEIH